MDAELAYLSWLAGEEKTRQENVVWARRYYDGHHEVPLTERQEEYLGFNLDEQRFALNYCKTIVSAVVDRLIVQGFESENEEFAKLAWDWWQQSRMDALQMAVHKGAVCDGEFFVFVDIDRKDGKLSFIPHPRYTDPQRGGTGFGCKAFYPDDNTFLPMSYAAKRWAETIEHDNGRRETRQRMTAYYPDRIEKYALVTQAGSEAGWEPVEVEGEPWPLPWVDGSGRPLGIPIVHFYNPDQKSELWDAIPPQDAINKTALDILAAADAAGFEIIFTYGFYPTTDGKEPASDGSNYMKIFPGVYVGVPNTEARAEKFEAANISGLLDGLDSLIVKLAQITDTPISRFQMTRQIAAEGTLKQQEEPLLAKVRTRQVLFGNAWENVIYAARRLYNVWGQGGANEEAMLSTQWVNAEIRDEKQYLETLKIKRELEIPREIVWAEMGYDQDAIANMLAKLEEERASEDNLGARLLQAFERGE